MTRHQFTRAIAIAILLAAFSGCKTFFVTQSGSSNLDTSKYAKLDTPMLKMIEPYREELELAMDIELAQLENDLIKEQPESTLGNHIAQITLKSAERDLGTDIDFGVMNYGGLRVTAINKGPLMIRDAYQIMPFDNYVVVMDLKGAVIQKLFDQIASAGGWPVQDASYVIEGGKATNLKIKGEELDPGRSYSMAISDYLANGGDHLDILKTYSYYNTGILLRDAIMEQWKLITDQGLKVIVEKDGRVTNKDNE